MVNAFSGCTTNHGKNGCGFNSGSCAGGCPSSTCCKQKTECQITLQTNLDKVAAYRLQLRLLSDDFKKRPSSKCSTHVPLTKAAYTKKKAKIEKKIKSCLNANKNLKNSKKSKLLVRKPKSFCNGVTTGGDCPCAHVKNFNCRDYAGVC